MKPQISVIVPIYGVENYLRQCVDSLLAQDFVDFEMLLIDDGSPDGSPEICDEYAKLDSRVRVFHKPNGGVGSARNVGIDNARGEWIAFVDADDFVGDDYLSKVGEYICDEEIDLVYFGYNYIDSNKNISKRNIGTCSKYDIITLCKESKFSGLVWLYLYRKSIIEAHGLRFSTDVKYAEDWEFILKYYSHIEREVMVLDELLYNQCHREGSATNQVLGEGYIRDNFLMFHRVLSYTSTKESYFRKFVEQQLQRVIIWFVNNVIFTLNQKKIYREEFARLLKKHPSFAMKPIVWVSLLSSKIIFRISVKLHNNFM